MVLIKPFRRAALNADTPPAGDAPATLTLPAVRPASALARLKSTALGRHAVDYGTAVAAVAVAVALTVLFWDALDRNPAALFYAAVMVGAWRGGFGPGLLGSMLALLAIDFFLMPSFFTGSWRDAVQAGTFVAIAGLLSWLNHARDRAMADLLRAKQEADDANAAKDQFLAVLSHELRTPLTPVLGLATVIEQDETVSDEVRADATVIRRNAELEARLIDDLLDITRIRQGKLSLNRKPVELTALIHEVLRTCGPDAEAKKIRIRPVLTGGPRRVYGDPARLQQVLWNLLKNAIKFTPSGGQVTLVCSDDGAGTDGRTGGRIKVDVMDTGIGIDARTLSRVFNAFEQGGSAVTRRFGGIGLGLAISKALAEAHGGTLTAASEGAGRGACFTLTIDALAEAPAVADRVVPKTPGIEPLKVLLVEDHPDTSDMLTRLLRNLNHQVEHAASVRAARQLADSRRFDFVISDIGLPDGSGVELMRDLKSRYQLKGIAMSGYGMEEDVRRSLSAGFAAHLTKPLNLDLLEAAIGELAAAKSS